MSKFSIIIASVPDRDELVAEVKYENTFWAEISHENDEMMIQFYPHPHKDNWEIPFEGALKALEQAKQRMIRLGPKHPTPLDARRIEVEKYQQYFCLGTCHKIFHNNETISIILESSKINPATVENKFILSKDNTLRGKITLENVQSVLLNDIPPQISLSSLCQNTIIHSFNMSPKRVELQFKDKKDLSSATPKTVLTITADTAYWGNFPTLDPSSIGPEPYFW